jgi:hypothetical protein
MGCDKGFILGVMERWNLIAAAPLIACAVFLACYACDFVSGLALALFLSIVGAGVVLKRKVAILIYKLILWSYIVLCLTQVTNPYVIAESHIESYSLTGFYCFCALVIGAGSAVLILIAWGQKRETRNRR